MTDTASAADAGTMGIGGDLTVNRLGFGAMRITGSGISTRSARSHPKDEHGIEALAIRHLHLPGNGRAHNRCRRRSAAGAALAQVGSESHKEPMGSEPPADRVIGPNTGS